VLISETFTAYKNNRKYCWGRILNRGG